MIRLQAPAKLNLYLRVIGRRPDGYHELETLFERIDLADELTFTPHPDGLVLTCDDPTLDCGEDNLVLTAARLLQQRCRVTQGAAIHLTKRIPIAGGLGGGSSDAATTLVGLNRMWETALSSEQLRELAAEVGSDVPFFIEPHAFAVGRGRGERCEPWTGASPTLWHVLLVPPVRLSTKIVYEGFDAHQAARQENSTLTARASSITMLLHALRNGPALAGLAKGLVNDLEPEAIRRCPVIRDLHLRLRESGSVGTLTSGSGPCVFGLCRDDAHAQQVARRVRDEGSPEWSVRIIRTHHVAQAAERAKGLTPSSPPSEADDETR